MHAARAALILGAAVVAVHGWSLLDANWGRNYDSVMRWYGLVVMLLALAVMPTPPFSKPALPLLRDFLVRHRWELAALAIVLAIGVFMRIYDLGHFPPKSGTSFEEAQTGGNGYAVLHQGRRPINFAITDYTGALGFSLFGYSTDGLRMSFLLFGVATFVLFYLLVRLLVSAPAALFATALIAVSRWHAFSARIADELFSGMNLSIVTALLLVAMLRTRNGLLVIASGLSIGLLNYEYTGYRYIPFLLVATIAITLALRFAKEALVRRQIVWTGLFRRWWLGPVFALALFIAVTPIIVDSLRGGNDYYEALERHRVERQKTTFFGLPSTWERNVKWSFEVFLPAGPGRYLASPPLTERGVRMFDPVTAGLALLGLAYALLSFRRPYRLLFSAWFLIGLIVGGVLPNNFYVPRFTPVLPAMFVMIGFVVDDVLRFASTFRLRLASYCVLVALAVWAMFINFGALRSQANDSDVRKEFANSYVSLCAFTRDLGPNVYAYVWNDGGSTVGVFVPSDYTWICKDVVGEPLNSPVAVAPLAVPGESNVAFVYVTSSEDSPDPKPFLSAAYPQHTWRVDKEDAPFDTYVVSAYLAPASDLTNQQGLNASYEGAGSTTQRVDASALFVSGGAIDWPEGAAGVSWQGLVLLEQDGDVALAPTSPFPIDVTVDGMQVYSSRTLTPSFFNAGWHTVRASVRRDEAGLLPRLAWVSSTTEAQTLGEDDLFAISPPAWTHDITVQSDYYRETLHWQQIEPLPVPGSAFVFLPRWLNDVYRFPRGTIGTLKEETWRARWQAPSTGHYELTLTAKACSADVVVEGAIQGTVDGSLQTRTETIPLDLTAGEHTVEIHTTSSDGSITGVSIVPPAGISIGP